MGVGEVELLKLGEVSKEIQTATHLSVGEAEDLMGLLLVCNGGFMLLATLVSCQHIMFTATT